MATVYIGIGMVKTGTTALQTFMRENEEVMKKQGYCYPFLDLGINKKYDNKNAHFLVYRSEAEDRETRKAEEKAVRDHAYEQLKCMAEKYPNIVLSEELIWHRSNGNPNFWNRLGPNFAKIGCDVKVIVYLRRQDLLIQSLYNQSVKRLPLTSLTFEECIKGTFFDYMPLDYAEHLKKIAEGIGRENLIVKVYERGQFVKGDLYADFAGSIGLELTEEFTKNNIVSNDALNGNFLEIKRWLNEIPEYTQGSDFIWRPICRASEQKGNQKTGMFTYEEQKAYVDRFAESNATVAREFLGREDGVLFAEPVKELPVWKVEPEQMNQDIVMTMGEIFCAQELKIRKLQENYEALKNELKELKQENKAMYNSLIFRGYRKVRNGLGGKKEK